MLGNGAHVLGNGPHVLGYGPHGLGNGPYLCTQLGCALLGCLFILAPIGLGNGPHVLEASYKKNSVRKKVHFKKMRYKKNIIKSP